MNIVQLIEKAGLANIKTQVVSYSLVRAQIFPRHSRITFETTEEMASSTMRESAGIPGDYYGVVVWIPRDKYEEPAT